MEQGWNNEEYKVEAKVDSQKATMQQITIHYRQA